MIDKLPTQTIEVITKNVIPSLVHLITNYDPKTHFQLIFATGCGYITSLQLSLFPDYEDCLIHKEGYDSMDVVLLNLDRDQ